MSPTNAERPPFRESDWRPRLDERSTIPLYEQVIEQTAFAISTGRLRPGDSLPSVRTLAAELRLNPNTTARALRETSRLGLTRALRGQGFVVEDDAPAVAEPLARQSLERELKQAARVGRFLQMDLNEMQRALAEVWEERDDD